MDDVQMKADGPTTVDTYRQFLGEPGVEGEFHTLKADLHRASARSDERLRLERAAAAAEVDAGRLARTNDEDQHRRLDFLTGAALALLLAAADVIPAYLAGQAFGADQQTTAGITVLLVAALAAGMWAVSHFRSGWRRWLVIVGLAAGLTAMGALRWWYLLTTAGDQTSAVLEAVGLTVFTTLLVWLGTVVLGLTKSRAVSRAERRAVVLRRAAEAAARADAGQRKRAETTMREFMGRAQVFSSRALDGDRERDRFVEFVRREIER